jgi:hypothetical protein
MSDAPFPAQIAYRIAERSLRLASVRYRGLMPACALREEGFGIECITHGMPIPAETGMVFTVKPLTSKEASFVERASGAGLPVVLDLCDNIFIDGYAGQGQVIADRFRSLVRHAAAITVPTSALAAVVHEQTGVDEQRIRVVPDIVEDATMLTRQAGLLGQSGVARIPWRDMLPARAARLSARLGKIVRRQPMRRILWFGNHGAGHANFGISDILLFREALEAVARSTPIELWVVSNSLEKFEAIVAGLAFRSRYFEWHEGLIDLLLRAADLCIVPNSLDAFSATKSANRALKSLAAHVPVVATPTMAYEGMADALWTGDPLEGIRACLEDRALVSRQMQAADHAIETRYSFVALRRYMRDVVARIVQEQA